MERKIWNKNSSDVKDLMSILKYFIIPLICTFIEEIFTIKVINIDGGMWLPRMVVFFGLIALIEVIVKYGLNKTIEYIINHRIKLSLIMILVSSIIGYFYSMYPLKNWLTKNEFLTIKWNIEFYALLLISFEVFKIITSGKNKESFYATLILVLSSAVQYNFAEISIVLILGEALVYLVERYINAENKNLIYGLLFIILSVVYTYTSITYAVPMGYVFAGLIIWLIIENKKKLKEKRLKNIGLIFLIVDIVLMFVSKRFYNCDFYNITGDTDYKGAQGIFVYLYNIYLPFKNIANTEMISRIFAIFPIPFICALLLCYKSEENNKEDDKVNRFIIPLSIVSFILTVFLMMENVIPEFIKNITLLGKTNDARCFVALDLASLYLLIYIMENVNKKIMEFKPSIYFIIAAAVIMSFITGFPEELSGRIPLIVFTAEVVLPGILFLNFDDPKYKKVCYVVLVFITLISCININSFIIPKVHKFTKYEEINYDYNYDYDLEDGEIMDSSEIKSEVREKNDEVPTNEIIEPQI